MVKIRYFIVSDCVELRGVVVSLRTVRHMAQEVIRPHLTAKGPVRSHDKADGVYVFVRYLSISLTVSSNICSMSRQ